MVPNPTIKIRKTEWGLTVYTEVLNYSRAQKVIDMFWNIRGINLAFYYAFDAKKRQKLCTQSKKIRSIKYKNYYNARRKGILGLPIISTVTTLTSCFKKNKNKNQILILLIIITAAWFPYEWAFTFRERERERETEREESGWGTQRCKLRRRIPWQRMVSCSCGDHERRVIFS